MSALWLPSDSRPSYQSGYARNAAESANPGLWEGLVGAWVPAMGPTGSIIRDLVGNKNAAFTSMDAVSDWTPTEKGYAVQFDGVNDYTQIDNALSNSRTTWATNTWKVGFALAFWWKPDTITADRGFCNFAPTSTASSGPCLLQYQANSFRFYTYGAASWSSNFSLDTNWHHFCMQYHGEQNPDVVDLYFDGELIDSKTDSGNMYNAVTGSDNLYFGESFGGNGAGKLGTALLYQALDPGAVNRDHRLLSPNQIRHLASDPLAPFRQRRYIPFSESVADSLGGIIRVPVKSDVRPSYKSGYARNAAESANPGLWDGLIAALLPSLGQTGSQLLDVSGYGHHGSFTNMDSSNWEQTKDGTALDLNGTDERIALPDRESIKPDYISFTIRAKFPGTDPYERVAAYDAGSVDAWGLTVKDKDSSQAVIFTSNTSIATGASWANTDWSEWLTITGTRDGSNLNLYINGTLQDTYAKTGVIDYGSFGDQITYIGNDGAGAYKNFKFSAAYIHDRALTANEAMQLHVDPLAPFRRQRYILFGESVAAAAEATGVAALVPRRRFGDITYESTDRSSSINSDLLAWYPFTEGGGTVIRDVFSKRIHEFTGNPTWIQSIYGKALNFDGDDSITLFNWIGTWTHMSFALWFRTTDTGGSILSSQEPVSTYIELSHSSTLRARWDDSAANLIDVNATGGPTVDDGEWHHAVGTVSNTNNTGTLYVDGVKVGSNTNASFNGNMAGDGTLTLGSDSAGLSYYTGDINDVRIYKRALTGSEAKDLFTASRLNYPRWFRAERPYKQYPMSLGQLPAEALSANRKIMGFF